MLLHTFTVRNTVCAGCAMKLGIQLCDGECLAFGETGEMVELAYFVITIIISETEGQKTIATCKLTVRFIRTDIN